MNSNLKKYKGDQLWQGGMVGQNNNSGSQSSQFNSHSLGLPLQKKKRNYLINCVTVKQTFFEYVSIKTLMNPRLLILTVFKKKKIDRGEIIFWKSLVGKYIK